MAYSELIKDFKRIRAYLRDFYVYGFKVRGDFTEKSGRSYDNERRRVESWMGDYVSFSQDSRGSGYIFPRTAVQFRTIPCIGRSEPKVLPQRISCCTFV